jgi:hypothetical protein
VKVSIAQTYSEAKEKAAKKNAHLKFLQDSLKCKEKFIISRDISQKKRREGIFSCTNGEKKV